MEHPSVKHKQVDIVLFMIILLGCFGRLLFVMTQNVQSTEAGQFDSDKRGAALVHRFALLCIAGDMDFGFWLTS